MRLQRTIVMVLLVCSLTAGCIQSPEVGAAQTSTPFQSQTTAPSATPSRTATVQPSPTPSPTNSPSPSATRTATAWRTATITRTPTITLTATATLTATYDFPDVTVNVQAAHCRYGPSTGYLHAADLYEGDHGTVRGRNNSASWLYIKFDKLHYFCWVAASVVDTVGNVMLIYPTERKLPKSVLYKAPKNVQADRDGDTVRVTWDKVNMTEDDDRGYMIEAYICQDERYLFYAVATDNTFYEFEDEAGCPLASNGLLYTVEKHGYTDPVKIPWPAP